AYVDESWINDPVRLIPRLREWIDQFYPGTRLAIGEWNWGGEDSMSGGLAVADVLGIFGREGVDMANYWTAPPPGSPAALAFALYKHFGDQAIAATLEASPDYITAYASCDSATGDVLLVAINKRWDADVAASIRLEHRSGGVARVFSISSADSSIREAAAIPLEQSELDLTLPAASVSLVRVGGAGSTDT
ncbi:MAG: endoglucanase, partial [Chloroflexi bacterium]|nr:endoglucanase [Chloroflexota bacterium]